jgi:DNA-binding response OmpR family regulator
MVMIEQKLKILIVDDNQSLRNLLNTTFNIISNCEIFNAQNGSEALNLIRKERPQIVFLDIMMPGDIDGYSVCEFVKSSNTFKDTFVVILTAKAQKGDMEYGISLGADKYLTKPFSPLNLIKVIKDWRIENFAEKETILVIDDDEDLLNMMSKALHKENYDVITTQKSTEIIDIIKSQKINLIITDIMMPEKDGIDLIDEIFEFDDSMPIIAITGNLFFLSAVSDPQSARLLGVRKVLKKPFTLPELNKTVTDVLKATRQQKNK